MFNTTGFLIVVTSSCKSINGVSQSKSTFKKPQQFGLDDIVLTLATRYCKKKSKYMYLNEREDTCRVKIRRWLCTWLYKAFDHTREPFLSSFAQTGLENTFLTL